MTERGAQGHPDASLASPLVVPATASGVATALTHASAGLPDGPERSDPAARPHPPLIRVGEQPRLPDRPPATTLELVVPDSLGYVFVAAPLAYYLGARVTVGDGPRLVGPDIDQSLPPFPAFEEAVATLLARAFHLDCRLREGRPVPAAWTGGVAPETLRAGTPADRLRAVLDGEGAAGPEWPLAMYVAPTADHVPCLPHLLADLAAVYRPESSPLDGRELLTRALDDFFRTPGPIENVPMVAPTLRAGDLHGWLAEGVPIEAFIAHPAAYEHRRDAPVVDGPLDVHLVLADTEMADEVAVVERAYRRAPRPLSLSVHDDPERATVARLFEESHDLVHFVGHCEVEGLRCHDGPLDLRGGGDVGTRAFFLNACGSYAQGRALIERGAVAGAVTLRGVLNRPAVTVGGAFARLLVGGFGFQRALALARRQITMSTDYAVVGDGIYTLGTEGGIAHVERAGDAVTIEYTEGAAGRQGATFADPFGDRALLCGEPTSVTLPTAEAAATIERLDCPLVYDGELHWPETVIASLGSGP